MAKRVVAKKKSSKSGMKKTTIKRPVTKKRAAAATAKPRGAKKGAPRKPKVDPLFKKGGLNDLFTGKLPHDGAHAHSYSHEVRPLRPAPQDRVPVGKKGGLPAETGADSSNQVGGLD